MFLEQFLEEGKTEGWIEVVCGSMFSGKTEELIRRLKRAQFANQQIMLFKPVMDKRYSEENVVSHQGTSLEAISITKSNEILDLWKGARIVAIDEAQFFDGDITAVCTTLANKGVRVIIAGLDMDYKGSPFGSMPLLMAVAEYVTKVHAICVSCGNLAQFSNRLVKDTDLVMLGAVNSYRPLCRSCFNKVEF
jgi:thymidine kinase